LQASLDAAEKSGLPRFDVLQPEYNVYTRQKFEGPIADLCIAENIGVISYYALAAGFLTGKYRKVEDAAGKARGGRVSDYLNPRGESVLSALDQVARETATSMATVAIAWVTARPGVTAPIASATSLDQLKAMTAAGTLELSEAQMSLLNGAGA
jgi:aryl-alcohol dehydrogenase-like predicted oxidoreductase